MKSKLMNGGNIVQTQVHVDKVYPNILLGDAAFAKQLSLKKVQQLNLGGVVTIRTREVLQLRNLNINPLYIPVSDDLHSNLLPHFNDACEYIDRIIAQKKNVLVHCQKGRSRSATIVAAYIIRKEGITAQDALEYLQRVRANIQPNDAFLNQLDIYYRRNQLGYQEEPAAMHRNSWLKLGVFRNSSRTAHGNILRTIATNQQDIDVVSIWFRNPSDSSLSGDVYQCGACLHPLFTSAAIHSHDVATQPTTEQQPPLPHNNDLNGTSGNESPPDSSLFIHPINWMSQCGYMPAELQCPRCSLIVGEFKWTGGMCPCGCQQIFRPYVRIGRRRILTPRPYPEYLVRQGEGVGTETALDNPATLESNNGCDEKRRKVHDCDQPGINDDSRTSGSGINRHFDRPPTENGCMMRHMPDTQWSKGNNTNSGNGDAISSSANEQRSVYLNTQMSGNRKPKGGRYYE